MAVRLSVSRACRPLPLGRSLILASVRGWVGLRAILRLEGFGRSKNSTTSSGIKPATFIHIYVYLSRGLSAYRGEEICALQWAGELCWRERKLLVRPPMLDRSMSRAQAKCSSWSFRLGVWRGANEPSTLTTLPEEPMDGDHGGGQDLHRLVLPVKNENVYICNIRVHTVCYSCRLFRYT
jgi:hypothetical protein